MGDYPQIGYTDDSIFITSNQFQQKEQGGNEEDFSFAGTLITAFSVAGLAAGGDQNPWQTSSTAFGSLKPMIPASGSVGSTIYLVSTLTSTELLLVKYTNTNNLDLGKPPTLDSVKTVRSSISIGGELNYELRPELANGQKFNGGDTRLIGLSYASGRLLASCTSFYGPLGQQPKVCWFFVLPFFFYSLSFSFFPFFLSRASSFFFFSHPKKTKKARGLLLVHRSRNSERSVFGGLCRCRVERMARRGGARPERHQ